MDEYTSFQNIGESPFASSQEKANLNTDLSGGGGSLHPDNAAFLYSFFSMVVSRVKNTLDTIKTFTHLSRDKLDNKEFKEYFLKLINEDVEEIESVLNSLLGYVKINNPVIKSNTVHLVTEEALKKHESRIEGRNIKIVKRFGQNLPETVVPEQQLRYILNSLVEYAIALTVSNGTIGFMTKTSVIEKEIDKTQTLFQKDGQCVEIVIVFTGPRKRTKQFETVLGTPPVRKQEVADLKLLLVQQIIRRNRGIMKYDVDEKTPRTYMSLRFPVERRKVVYYPPTDA
jgi:nitrogen-specific signal transduction histidine kinase